jgi:glyoxylase-like metal-dependent hydrolase (beta-lactamase superfamily II)
MAASPIIVYKPDTHMWPAPANSYLLKDDEGGILIDAGCGFAECYGKIKAFLADNGLGPGDIHTVVLSHAHPDHMGAMPFLLEENSPRIYIHALEERLAIENQLLNETFDMWYINEYYLERLDGNEPAGIIEYFSALCPMGAATPTDTIVEGDVLELAGRRFEVIHTPGHAPGHVSLYDPGEKVLLCGDLMGAVVAWYCPSGGGARGYLDSLDKVEALDVETILPSHGEATTDVAAAIARTRDFILAREAKILSLLAGRPMSLLELTDELFPSLMTRMFPGMQITDSHLIMLAEDGRVKREDREGMPVFSLA